MIERVIAERLPLMPGAMTLVATMRANGARTALVSGGFTAFTRHVQALVRVRPGGGERAGDGGRRADRATCGRAARCEPPSSPPSGGCGTTWASTHAQTLAVGDGANDLPMLEEAGLGVAFRAHARVRRPHPAGSSTAI